MPAKPSAKANTEITADPRCKYVASSGRRCKFPAARDTTRASGYSAFCLPHSQMEQQYLNADSIAKELIGPLEDFCTQIAVSEVLGKLLILVAKNRIPLRNANTIAYICQLLISSNTGVRYELNLKGGEEEVISYINGTMEMMYGKPEAGKEPKEDDANNNSGREEPHPAS